MWSNTAISDPRINIRAEREVVSAGVTAGIDVSGRASSPKATIWSNPAMEESAALAYLVLGRSLNTASTDESQKINGVLALTAVPAAGFAAGREDRLDDAGVLESRTRGVRYSRGQIPVPRSTSATRVDGRQRLGAHPEYLLRKGFDVEIESTG